MSSSPQSNFTKVTSKKSRARRRKEEGGRQSAGSLQEVQRTGLRAREFDRDKNKAEKKDSKASRDERRESGPGLDKETFPRLVKDDFPALPGGTESVPSVGAGAWGRPAKAKVEVSPQKDRLQLREKQEKEEPNHSISEPSKDDIKPLEVAEEEYDEEVVNKMRQEVKQAREMVRRATRHKEMLRELYEERNKNKKHADKSFAELRGEYIR